jgi:hypothetical protein
MKQGVNTMADFKSIFMSYMDRENIKYSDQNKCIVRVAYTGNNLKTIPMLVRFSENNDPWAQIACVEIANFTGKEETGIRLCNELNKEFRWLKFYLDKDADIIASLDTYIDDNTCGFFCLDLVKRSVSIIDEAYPQIARAMWG